MIVAQHVVLGWTTRYASSVPQGRLSLQPSLRDSALPAGHAIPAFHAGLRSSCPCGTLKTYRISHERVAWARPDGRRDLPAQNMLPARADLRSAHATQRSCTRSRTKHWRASRQCLAGSPIPCAARSGGRTTRRSLTGRLRSRLGSASWSCPDRSAAARAQRGSSVFF